MMIRKLLLAVCMSVLVNAADDGEDSLFLPDPLKTCLGTNKAKDLEVIVENPVYLRGDFDGDGKPDYAIQLKSKALGGIGLLVCGGSGSVFVLGKGIGGDKFSDKQDDRFLAPNWEVFTKKDLAELRKLNSNVPHPVPSVKGEAIAMIWEDGIALVYWNGTKFVWAGSVQ